jgi:Family of unknown function (DUF6470)/PRC-barrel domain
MSRLRTPAMLLGATALTLPLAFAPAAAQQQQEVGAEGACEQLLQLVQQSQQAGEELVEEFRQAPQVAEANEAEACVVMIEDIETAGGITAQAQERGQGAEVVTDTETFTARDRVSQTVEIEQEAVVEGQVMVRQPIPEIGIEQGSPQIEVSEAPVGIDIQEQPAEITIRQAPANVRVEIPQPTITIEQPAPEVVITMPPPGVSLDRQQPKVSVNIPDPTVTVSQADPEVTADVQARFVSGDELAKLEQQGQQPQIATQTERLDAAGNPVEAEKKAEVTVRQAEAEVMIQPPQDQGEVRIRQAEPRVVFEPSDPNVEVTFAENADVQVRQVGEPTVRIEREGEQQAAAQGQQAQGQQQAAMQAEPGQAQQNQAQLGQQQAAQGQTQQTEAEGTEAKVARLTPEDTNRLLGVQEGAEVAQGDLMQVTAADLEGRDVVTLHGEEVGEIEGIFQNGGKFYAIVAHGGFLGIGEDRVALPVERIAMQGDQVVLLGLTEEQLAQMPEYDFDTDQAMAGSDVVEIGRYE